MPIHVQNPSKVGGRTSTHAGLGLVVGARLLVVVVWWVGWWLGVWWHEERLSLIALTTGGRKKQN